MRNLIQRNTRVRNTASGAGAARTRGAALVEMAIVMPILCLLTLGLMEYGWVFVKVSQINQAARYGVRIAVRPDATEENVKSVVASLMSQAGIRSSDYTLTYSDLAVGVGQPVSVHISVNYDKITLTGTGLVPLPSKIQGHGTMSKEGPPAS